MGLLSDKEVILEQNSLCPCEQADTCAATKHYKPRQWNSLCFHGSGREYFRIWIVNLVLTLLTLGIYSAWATVRSRRYFYGNTEFAGARFEFHGGALNILLGRILILAAMGVLFFGNHLHPHAAGISAGLMALLFPWLLASSLRFRRRNTSLRGIRFNFSGSALQAYKALWHYYLMALILFGVLLVDRNLIASHLKINLETLNIAYIAIGIVLTISIPAIFMRDILQFSLCHTHYGKERFSAYLESSNFISFYWLAIFVAGLMYFFATALGLGLAYLVDLGTNNNTQSTTYGLDMMAGALILAMPYITQFISYYFVQASIFRESFRHLSLGNLRFMSSLLHIGYIGLMLKVTILTVFTLGFYYPWGRVALARYKVESVRVRGDIPLVFSAPLESASALGQEFTDGMNLDIGL